MLFFGLSNQKISSCNIGDDESLPLHLLVSFPAFQFCSCLILSINLYLMMYIFNSIFKTHESMCKPFASSFATPRKEKILSVQQHPVPGNSQFYRSGNIFECGQTTQKRSSLGDVVTHQDPAKASYFPLNFPT